MKDMDFEVGRRIKEARDSVGLSMRELHQRTCSHDPKGKGVQVAQISRIERGTATCDLRELWLIAHSLGVEPLQFVAEKPWFIVRSENIWKSLDRTDPVVVREGECAHGSHPFRMTERVLKVDACGDGDVPMRTDGQGEVIFRVLQGEVEFRFQQTDVQEMQKFTLNVGDSLHFSLDLKHGYRATGKEISAKALLICCN